MDIAQRRQMTAEAVAEAARGIGGTVLPDEELLDIVTNLVEIPVATAGRFDEMFLEVPKEILITAMREHQKYFAVVDDQGQLMPGFIAVNNTRTRDMNLVATGHERVLRARLSDARYFYQADIKVPMEDWVEKLKRVLFQAKLGSMHDKMTRVKTLAAWLADAINPAEKEKVSRAAHLCKADLVSQVVGEFANLQGIMGRTYAQVAGEPADVAAAIEEHYRPTHSGGQLPETETGVILAIADKIDSICGCFSVGLIPTGAADPYALRRQSIGILQMMRSRNIGIAMSELVEKGVSLFAGVSNRPVAETVDAVLAFLNARLARLLADDGLSKDVIAAVMGASANHIPDIQRRAAALEQLKGKPDFEPLAAAFKRVENILKKASSEAATRSTRAVRPAGRKYPVRRLPIGHRKGDRATDHGRSGRRPGDHRHIAGSGGRLFHRCDGHGRGHGRARQPAGPFVGHFGHLRSDRRFFSDIHLKRATFKPQISTCHDRRQTCLSIPARIKCSRNGNARKPGWSSRSTSMTRARPRSRSAHGSLKNRMAATAPRSRPAG